LYYPYPPSLIANADLSTLICRSNRVWSAADQGALEVFSASSAHEINFLLNGVDIAVVETVLGDLPKKRSRFRRMAKNLFRLQFFSRNQF
jgi:hypothetical protein